ncbi:MAG: ParB/RepB/Spo0J family partition protein [Candidatus Uhrbacteria bacterium]
MINTKPVLGRGLGSLIPTKKVSEVVTSVVGHQEVLEIPINDIIPNPHQPRHHFAAVDLDDLVGSIKEHGILQPLVVSKNNGQYELIAGERRWRAAKLLGLKTVPAIVRDASKQQKLEWALIENLQRADLNPLEEALAYRALIDEFNLTQEAAALRVGKSRPVVANTMRLLELPEEIQNALQEGKITKSHARTLLAETDVKKQRELFLAMLTGQVTVRSAEKAVSHHRPGLSSKRLDPNLVAHEKKLQEILGTKAEIKERGGKGTITLHFYSKDDLLDLLGRLSEI